MSTKELQELISLTSQYIGNTAYKQKKLVVSAESHAYFQTHQKLAAQPKAAIAPEQRHPPLHTPSPQQPIQQPLPQKNIEKRRQPPIEATTTPTETQETKKPGSTAFTTEKLSPTSPQDFSDIRAIITKKFPNIKIHDKTPSPADFTKSHEERDKKAMSIIIKGAARTEEECIFLTKITSYLNTNGISTTIVNSASTENDQQTVDRRNTHFLNLGEVARFLSDQQLKIKLRDHLKSLFPNIL